MRRLFGLRPLGFAAAMACVGCSSAEPELPAFLTSAKTQTAELEPAPSGFDTHDFGLVLARNAELHCNFFLANSTDAPLRLLGFRGDSPCCSRVGAVASTVPPRGRIALPISFRPGRGSGPRQASFSAQVDDPSRPFRRFLAIADLVPEVEIREADSAGKHVVIGRESARRFLVICRRIGDQGRGRPESVVALSPLVSATLTTLPVSQPVDHRVTAATARVDVVLPPSSGEGIKQGEFEIRWAGGLVERHNFTWEVDLLIRAIPAGFVLAGESGMQRVSVLVTTSGSPFRILTIGGDLIASDVQLSVDAKNWHRLDLVLDTSRSKGKDALDVTITTDDPEQRRVKIAVLVTPTTAGERR